MALKSFVGAWPLFQFLIFYRVGRTTWTGGSARRKAATWTHRTAQTHSKRIQTSMPQVGFEPTIPVFERAKTVHALDRAANVIGRNNIYIYKYCEVLKLPYDFWRPVLATDVCLAGTYCLTFWWEYYTPRSDLVNIPNVPKEYRFQLLYVCVCVYGNRTLSPLSVRPMLVTIRAWRGKGMKHVKLVRRDAIRHEGTKGVQERHMTWPERELRRTSGGSSPLTPRRSLFSFVSLFCYLTTNCNCCLASTDTTGWSCTLTMKCKEGAGNRTWSNLTYSSDAILKGWVKTRRLFFRITGAST
jgi:hypothetical protein